VKTTLVVGVVLTCLVSGLGQLTSPAGRALGAFSSAAGGVTTGGAVAGGTTAAVEAAAQSGAVKLTILSATPVLNSPDQPMRVTAELTNTTAELVTGDINLRVAYDPFNSADELRAWTSRSVAQARNDAWTVKAVPHQSVAPGQTATFSFETNAERMVLGTRGAEPGWGPRGILVELETLAQGPTAADRSYVVYAPDEAARGRMNLTVVAGLTAGPGETRDKTLARLDTVATATAESWITWLLDPALLTAANDSSQGATQYLAARVRDAAESGKAVYTLPYQDIDEALLDGAAAGAAAAEQTSRELAQRTLEEVLGPDTAGLVGSDLSWAARGLSAAGAEFIRQSGSSAILLAPDQAGLAGDGAVHQSPGGLTLIAPDAWLGEKLKRLDGTLDVNTVLADAAFAALQGQIDGQVGVRVVVMPRGWEPSAGGDLLLRQLIGASWVETVTLRSILSQSASPVAALAAGDTWPGPSLSELRELLQGIAHDAAFASLTAQSGEYLARSVPPLLVPLSNATPVGQSRTEAARTALTDKATSVPPVQVVAGSEVNLISDDGMVPVVVENQSNQSVSGLVVKLTAQTNAIRMDDGVEVELSPGQSVTARVPVHAVANGVFDVRVDLLDQSGQPVTGPASMTMRIRAEWEDRLTAVIGWILGTVVVLGIIATARKRRADRRTGGRLARPGQTPSQPLAAADDPTEPELVPAERRRPGPDSRQGGLEVDRERPA
jgi:hypothetical protein